MKKKLFTLALCTIMAVVMAVPAFAAVTPRINLYQAYNLSPAFNTGLSIDIPFSNTNMAPILMSTEQKKGHVISRNSAVSAV